MSANFQGNMFNYLPDELVVHMCRYMNSYSLLKFGRYSDKYKLYSRDTRKPCQVVISVVQHSLHSGSLEKTAERH